jgi:hypothetical protein
VLETYVLFDMGATITFSGSIDFDETILNLDLSTLALTGQLGYAGASEFVAAPPVDHLIEATTYALEGTLGFDGDVSFVSVEPDAFAVLAEERFSMASKTQIANQALIAIGVTAQIANLETETSKEAIAIRLIFEDEVDFVLRDFPWPFATAYASLGLVTDDPNNDWDYAYRYPSDAVFVRRIATTLGRDNSEPPPYRIGRDDEGRLIYSDEVNANIEYTSRIFDSNELDPIFVSALVWKLGAKLAPSMSKIKDMAKTAWAMYEVEIDKAKSVSLNESQSEPAPDAEWITAR